MNLNYTLPDEYFEERLALPGHAIQGIQDQWLPKAFAYAYEHSQFYRAKWK